MAITTNGGAGTALSVSADLAAAISDESGTGVVVFNVLPTFGTTGVKLSGSTSGTTTIVSGATAGTSVLTLPVATDTLVGKATSDTLTNKILTSPTLTTPALGTPASGVMTNVTGLPLTTGVTGTLTATNGGTAQSTYTTGDSIYASASNTLSKLGIGSTGQVLTVAAGIPSWATPAAGTTANDQAFAFAVQVFA